MNCTQCQEHTHLREDTSAGLPFCDSLCQAKYHSGAIETPGYLKIRVATQDTPFTDSEVDIVFLYTYKNKNIAKVWESKLRRFDMYESAAKLLGPIKLYAFIRPGLNIGQEDVQKASTKSMVGISLTLDDVTAIFLGGEGADQKVYEPLKTDRYVAFRTNEKPESRKVDVFDVSKTDYRVFLK